MKLNPIVHQIVVNAIPTMARPGVASTGGGSSTPSRPCKEFHSPFAGVKMKSQISEIVADGRMNGTKNASRNRPLSALDPVHQNGEHERQDHQRRHRVEGELERVPQRRPELVPGEHLAGSSPKPMKLPSPG